MIGNHIRRSIKTPLEEISIVSLPRDAYSLASAIPLGVKVFDEKKSASRSQCTQQASFPSIVLRRTNFGPSSSPAYRGLI